jgi:hypothetical protein
LAFQGDAFSIKKENCLILKPLGCSMIVGFNKIKRLRPTKGIKLEKERYSSTEVQKIFRVEQRYKSPVTLLNAEERGEIPKAERVQRGKIGVRQWLHTQPSTE